ncbi:cytochrome P450 [Phenylobacterium sp.]|uniref:cytochrome P450 n=1 Tax=Phenylobacterium sp. TaxID=1871053 RepID=UPI0025FD36F9|nr:cytochrome P450 [Phenylobacterium sp.]
MPDRDAYPILPGALADKPTLSLTDRLRGRRLRMPWSVPDAMFHEPFVRRKTLIGEMIFIGDPVLAKHVLVDKAANYPKAPLELRMFSALFGQGLLGIDGDLWRKHRRTMAPAFDPRSVAGYAPAMAGCTEHFLQRWDELPDGSVVDAAEEMTALTLSIIARTMFHEAGQGLETLIARTLDDTPDLADFNLLDLLPVVWKFRMAARETRMAALFRPLDGAIAEMITAREASADPPDDLLSRLIAARDETTGAGLSAREVRDEVITIFMAGHETTATAMAWAWFLLAKHPHEAARLHAELDQVLGGRTPGQADIASLPFTRRLVDECLRLFPPAPGMSARIAAAPDMLGETPVKTGTYMVLAPWVQQRHRQTWDEPERFEPDRFLPERSEGRPRLATMPFGAGPRVCIGQMLAVNEIILILATVAQHYALDLVSDAPVKLHHNVTLRPRGGLPMRLRRRTRAAALAAE